LNNLRKMGTGWLLLPDSLPTRTTYLQDEDTSRRNITGSSAVLLRPHRSLVLAIGERRRKL